MINNLKLGALIDYGDNIIYIYADRKILKEVKLKSKLYVVNGVIEVGSFDNEGVLEYRQTEGEFEINDNAENEVMEEFIIFN